MACELLKHNMNQKPVQVPYIITLALSHKQHAVRFEKTLHAIKLSFDRT